MPREYVGKLGSTKRVYDAENLEAAVDAVKKGQTSLGGQEGPHWRQPRQSSLTPCHSSLRVNGHQVRVPAQKLNAPTCMPAARCCRLPPNENVLEGDPRDLQKVDDHFGPCGRERQILPASSPRSSTPGTELK